MRLVRRVGIVLAVVEVVLVAVFAVLGFWVRVQPWFVAGRIVGGDPRISSSLFRDYGYLHGNDPWIEYWIAYRLWSRGLEYWSCLKPDCDLWAGLFWYPWGRDFTRSEYPLLPMFAAATYRLVEDSMSLQAWIALLPPLAGAILVVVSYVVARILFGRLAGVVAALLVAFLPANMDRTMAGFVEKEGFALPIVLLSIGLLCAALRMGGWRSVVVAVVGGVVGGVAGFAWGGFRFTLIAAGLAGLFAPLFLRSVDRLKDVLRVVLGFVAANAVLLLFSPASASGVRLALLAFLASAVGYVVWVSLEKFVGGRIYVSVTRLYTCFVVVLLVGVLGLVLAGVLPFNFRALYAVLWPVRNLLSFPPLIASVAEHYPPTMQMLVNELGIVLALAPLGIVLGLWDSYRRGDLGRAVMLLVSAGAFWAMLGMAYFLQSGGVFATIAAASLLFFFEEKIGVRKSVAKKKVHVSGLDELWKALFIVLVIVFVASASIAGYAEYNRLSRTATSVLTGGAGLGVNPGWFVLLDVINTTTPKDAVIVTWWDYGYWITVPTARATLADGATLNGTQISLLGRILTGSEQESSELMKKLGLEPGKTFVMVHEVVLVNETGGEVIFEPLLYRVDMPKSYWMLRIGGRNPDNYFSSMIEDVGGGKVLIYTVDFGKKAVQEALMYKILVDAAYRLGDKAYVLTDLKIEKVDKVIVPAKDENNNMKRVLASKPELREFRPWKIIAYSFPLVVGDGLRPVLLIALYQWTG